MDVLGLPREMSGQDYTGLLLTTMYGCPGVDTGDVWTGLHRLLDRTTGMVSMYGCPGVARGDVSL